MTSEKKDEKLLSFDTEQKMEFEKFNCFFVGFLRSSFGRINVMSTVVTQHICFVYQLTGLYDKRFYRTVFPIVLFKKIFYFVNAPDYCF